MLNPFRAGIWPPSTPAWAMVFFALCMFIGLLGFVQQGRWLRRLTTVCLGALACIVLAVSDAGVGLASALWLFALAAVVGDAALEWLGTACSESTAEWLGMRALSGFGVLSCAAGLLALLGALNHLTVTIACASISVLLLPRARRMAAFVRTLGNAEAENRWTAIGMALLALCFAFPLLWALAPAVQWDALTAHLPVSAALATAGGFAKVSGYWLAYFPGQAYLLYGTALALGGQPAPALIHLSLGLITTLLVFALTLRLAGRLAAWLATAGFASMPIVAWEAGSAYIDLFPTAYAFGALYAVITWREAPGRRWLTLAGLFSGLAVASKPSAWALLLPLIAYLLLSFFRDPAKRAVHGLANFFYGLGFFPLAWYARNWWVTGNPFYPMYGPWFHGNPPKDFALNWSMFGVGSGPLYFLRLPYDLIVNGPRFDESGQVAFGFLPLLAVVATLVLGRRLWKEAAGVVVWVLFAGLALWFSIGQVSRYALPFAPLMAVVAALPVGKWLPRIRGPLLTAGLLLAGLAYVGYMRSVATVWNYNIPDAYPYRFALGLESGEAFLTRALRVYPALHYIGQRKSGPESRVLSATAQIKYYADFAVDDPVFSSRVSDLAAMTAGEALYNELTSRGYEYVLIDNDLLKGGKPPVYATPAFLQQYAQIAFAANRVMVYRLKGDKPVERNARELLTNNGFDALDGNSQPTGWIRFGNPLTVVDPKRAASAPACVEVTQDDGLYQRVPAKKEQTYLVRIRARSDSPDQSAWLQIVWFNRSLAIVDGSITAVKVDGSWREYEVPVTAVHPEVAFGAAYARAAAGSKVLVDDVSFSLLE